jgi:predicted acetyltransferase
MKIKIEIEINVSNPESRDSIEDIIGELEDSINYQFEEITGFQIQSLDINETI